MHALLWPMRRARLGPESIREIVFGTEDGVVQNMALIAGMVGATLSDGVIVLAGSINAIAGVLAMSMGTYLSSEAERDALMAHNGGVDAERSPVRDALVMALAYGVGALVPLVPFMLPLSSRPVAVIGAVVLAGSALFLLGVVKAEVSGKPRVRAGLQLLALASAAGIAGYLIGRAAQAVFGIAV
jgi:VIT1/CCC1 family predicted Fe2+/Mn2+ transporter